ncbi:hypothetical protein [Paenibacillus amylolyticus]
MFHALDSVFKPAESPSVLKRLGARAAQVHDGALTNRWRLIS